MTDSKPTKTKSAWIKHKIHEDILLPSGMYVDISIPNLPAMIKSGQLPNPLLDVATKAATDQEVPEDLFEKLDELNTFLVSKTVVKPEITVDEVNDLPAEDLDMLIGFATRSRDLDAAGNHIAGLEKIPSFRRFRGLDSSG